MKEDHISFKARMIAHSVDRTINKATSAMGLTSSQAFILGYIFLHRNERICQKDIENHFNIKHPTATGILQRLAEKDFIVCLPDACDRRFKIITGTEKAERLHNEIAEQIRQSEEYILGGLDADELAELNRLLDKVLANVTPEPFRPEISQQKEIQYD